MLKLKEPSDENRTECHEVEPNPSKDRAKMTPLHLLLVPRQLIEVIRLIAVEYFHSFKNDIRLLL
jgi:hypothetical protein